MFTRSLFAVTLLLAGWLLLADAQNRTATIEGTISEVNRGNPRPRPGLLRRITVKSATDAGTVSILKDATKLSKKDGDKTVPALHDELKVGATVRVLFSTPVMESFPWQSDAVEVLILKAADK